MPLTDAADNDFRVAADRAGRAIAAAEDVAGNRAAACNGDLGAAGDRAAGTAAVDVGVYFAAICNGDIGAAHRAARADAAAVDGVNVAAVCNGYLWRCRCCWCRRYCNRRRKRRDVLPHATVTSVSPVSALAVLPALPS